MSSNSPSPARALDGSDGRSLSLVNAARPPQNRKRVWRACNPCKKKKSKCDGSEPCQSCINNSAGCIYPDDPSTGGAGLQTAYVQRLEGRLEAMESMLRSFMDGQPTGGGDSSNDSARLIEHNQARPAPAPVATKTRSKARSTARSTVKATARLSATPEAESITVGLGVTGALDGGHADLRQACDLDATPSLPADDYHNEPMAASLPVCAYPEPTPRTLDVLVDPDLWWNTPKEAGAEASCDSHSQAGASVGSSHATIEKRPYRYADEHGELEIDSTGELRYAGSQATVNIFNTCDGLRSYIKSGLQKKGYQGTDSYWDSPSESLDQSHCFHGTKQTWSMPPPKLVDTLIDLYYSRLYSVFPMVQHDDFARQYRRLLLSKSAQDDFLPVLFALLAVSAPMLPLDDPVFNAPDCAEYRDPNLALYFYSVARNAIDFSHYTVVSLTTLKFPLNTQKNSVNKVMALGLLASYLAATGNEAEAWTTIGSVVRLSQDLGLHRSPEKLRLPESDWTKRRCIWLCLYVLDRSVSISLGRQLAINDGDCDVVLPDQRDPSSPSNSDLSAFFALVRLHRISGEIITLTNSVCTTQVRTQSRSFLRQRVGDLAGALRDWAADSVTPSVKNATQGRCLTERCVLLCAFFASAMLLHRPFMSNPHRQSPLGNEETVKQCARAAIGCIDTAAECVSSIPPSPFLSLYGQQVFVSCVLLMHCMRVSKDEISMTEVLGHVEKGMAALKAFEPGWSGARKCRAIVEEFLEFTLNVLQNGSRGRCYFADEEQQQANGTADHVNCAPTCGGGVGGGDGGTRGVLNAPGFSQAAPEFNSNTAKKRKAGPLDPDRRAKRHHSHRCPAVPCNQWDPRPVGVVDVPGHNTQPQPTSEDIWGADLGRIDAEVLCNWDSIISADYVSPFFQMDEVMGSYDDQDIWSII